LTECHSSIVYPECQAILIRLRMPWIKQAGQTGQKPQ